MMQIALKMLVGNRGKYFGMVFGVFLSAMIITQQASIFTGLISRTFGFLTDTKYPDIWVMDPMVQFVDDFKPMVETKLLQVRGIDGVAWAVPLYKGLLKARLEDGSFQQTNVIGLDDASLTGAPPIMLSGNVSDLRRSDGIIVDDAGNQKRFARTNPIAGQPKIPLVIGDAIEINDKRAVVVGIARVQRTFQTNPVIYTTYSRALTFAPKERKSLTYILVKSKDDQKKEEVAARIQRLTGLHAMTNDQFSDSTVTYFLKNTGIPINFGIAVILGLIIGTAICGQTFYGFTLDNIRYFGALKAMGASNWILLKMICLQAVVVGLIGYGAGTGFASLFYFLSKNSELAFRLPWQILAITGVAVTFTCLVAALLSMLKVFFLEPAIVFKGE